MGLAIVGSIGVYLSKIPKLLETFIATGTDLCKLGYANVKRMGEIGAAVKNDAPPEEKQVEVTLKSKLS